MDDGALIPDRNLLSGVVTEETSPESEALENKDKYLAHLFNHPDWVIFADLVDKEINKLRKLEGVDWSILKPEDIGQRFIVASLAAETVENLLLKVKESAGAVFKNE